MWWYRWSKRLRASALSIVTMTAASSARANDCFPSDALSTCVDADQLWTHPGDTSWWSQGPVDLPSPRQLVTSLTMSYVRRPLGLVIASPDPAGKTVFAVDNALTAQLGLGLGLIRGLSVSVVVPLRLFQDGSGKSEITGLARPLSAQGLGDIRFGTHVRLFPDQPHTQWPALAMRFEASLPTGSSDAFMSSPSVVFSPATSLKHQWGPLSLGVDVGARIRRESELVGTLIGSELTASIGAQYLIAAPVHLSVGAEVFSRISLLQQSVRRVDPIASEVDYEHAENHLTPTEWLLSLRSAHLDDLVEVAVAGGSSVPFGANSDATAPALRVLLSARVRLGDATRRANTGASAAVGRRPQNTR